MGTVISNLKAHFGVDTTDFKAGLKDGEKAMSDFKGAAGGEIDEFARMFGVNMTGVNNAIGTASKALNYLSETFKVARTGANILALGFDLLKKAALASGIGALLVVLGSLIAYFSETERGSKKLASGMAEVKAAGKVLLEHLGNLGEGLMSLFSGDVINGFSQIKESFIGIGKEMKAATEEAKMLAQSTYDLNYMTMHYNDMVSEENILLSQYRFTAKDSTLSATERLKALENAAKIEHKIIKDGLDLDAEKLLNAQMALQTDKKSMDLKKALSAAYDAYNNKIAEEIDYDRTLEREKGKLIGLASDEANAKAMEKLRLATVTPDYALLEPIQFPVLNTQVLDTTTLALNKIKVTVKDLSVSIKGELMKSFEELGANLGTFFEELGQGDASLKSFGNMMVTTMAELAVNIGKIIISMALAKGLLEKAIVIPGAWPFALAAGIALVALGSALKGSLSSTSAGSGGSASVSGSTSGSNGLTYDMRSVAQAQTVNVKVTGTLEGSGSTLRAVIKNEESRLKLTT
jgi:hypothetical protein